VNDAHAAVAGALRVDQQLAQLLLAGLDGLAVQIERDLGVQLAAAQLGELGPADPRRARRVALAVPLDGQLDLDRQLDDPDGRRRRRRDRESVARPERRGAPIAARNSAWSSGDTAGRRGFILRFCTRRA